MKLVRYGPAGAEKPGLIDADDQLRDLSGVIDDISSQTLSEAMLARLDALDISTLPVVQGAPRLGPPVGQIGKFLCIGLNYSDHAAEAGLKVPAHPILFHKATSAVIGAYDQVMLPRGSTKTDWEIELGLVISKPCKYVSPDEALDYMAGYLIANDLSERHFQIELSGQWTKGKSCDTFGPIGPYLVTADEIPDPQNLDLELSVNGEVMQKGHTGTMIFSCAEIISHLSQFMTLHPGDIISTGTPPGVGMGLSPPRFLKKGDEMRLTISGLGHQQSLVGEDA